MSAHSNGASRARAGWFARSEKVKSKQGRFRMKPFSEPFSDNPEKP
jgi:hypothetical protein